MVNNMYKTSTILLSTILTIISPLSTLGVTLRFSWTDNQGDVGHFVWDTAGGFSPAAISEFSYIDYDGLPTPPELIPNSFTTFNDGLVWDLNTGVEGVVFVFTTAFMPPFPDSADA